MLALLPPLLGFILRVHSRSDNTHSQAAWGYVGSFFDDQPPGGLARDCARFSGGRYRGGTGNGCGGRDNQGELPTAGVLHAEVTLVARA
jgi:hypothetical protein